MRRLVSVRFLPILFAALLTLACALVRSEVLAADAPAHAKASVRFYQKRPQAIVLPTGCELGFGPQYRSFDPDLGSIVTISGDNFVDFHPVRTCAAAADVCSSQLSGMSCCKNACRQQHTGRQVGKVTMKAGVARFSDGRYDPTGIGAIFDPEGYRQCEAKCARVPTVRKFLTDYPSGAGTRTLRTKR